MLRIDALRLAVVALAFSSVSAFGQKSEDKRRALMNRLGVNPVAVAVDAGRPSGPDEVPAPLATGAPDAGPVRTLPSGPGFETVRPMLAQRCASCHRSGGSASTSGWVLLGEARPDFDSTRRVAAQLLPKSAGQRMHGGGKVFAVGSSEYALLARWVEGGARPGGESVVGSTAVEKNAEPKAPVRPEPVEGATTSELRPVHEAPAAPVHPEPVEGASTRELRPVHSDFAPIAALLNQACASCHAEGKLAAASRYLVSLDEAQHLASVMPLITPGKPESSALYSKARGDAHGGGAVLAEDSVDSKRLAQWITGLAPLDASDAGVSALPPASAAVPGPDHAVKPVEAGFIWAKLPVLGTFRLNGRFDLSLERTGYSDNPFSDKAKTGLQSYHHFLFLSRESADDPLSLSVEVTSLQFWHAAVRLDRPSWPVQLTAKVGKLLVPFGGDPLYHHSYGGTVGFDQRVLPPIFAREGANISFGARAGGFAFSSDAYLIAGYRLRTRDAVLSLQSDLSPLDDVHLGLGARLGASYGPLNLWYSAYFNPLGFGRRLFMQAVDVTLYRPRAIKVLEYFSFGLGVLRADVSGGGRQGYGGPGEDYYHFASYFEVRAYPWEWLYVQYRQGLRTFNNRRGLFLDSSRLTAEDSSTHNVGIVARWRGASVGLYHFWNLEKVNETPNDFTRLMVAYDF